MSKNQLQDLLKESGVKPRIIRELRYVPQEITDWEDKEFLVLTDKSRTQGVLLYGGKAASFLLRSRRPNRLGRTEPVICDLCYTWQRGSNSGTISFNAKNSTVTYLCCLDLACSLHVRDKTLQSALSRAQLRENMTTDDRIARLNDRLRALFSSL